VFVYKIRRADGLFSTGTVSPSFTKTGKAWSNIGHVKTHLQLFYNSYKKRWELPKSYDECEICCYELDPKLASSFSMQRMKESLNLTRK
jgi:predicted transcriptional regulator